MFRLILARTPSQRASPTDRHAAETLGSSPAVRLSVTRPGDRGVIVEVRAETEAEGHGVGVEELQRRLLEFGFLRKVHPLLSARLAAAMHPVGMVVFALVGTPAAVFFGILHGAGNGMPPSSDPSPPKLPSSARSA